MSEPDVQKIIDMLNASKPIDNKLLVKFPPPRGPEILFIRHGEGEHNISNHAYRDGDPTLHDQICVAPTHRHRLTDRGIAQAKQLGEVLKTVGTIDKVYASDMVRALETAYVATEALDPKPAITPWELLQERVWGNCEWKKSHEPQTNVWMDRAFFLPQGWQPDQGETSMSVITRARIVLEKLLMESVHGLDLKKLNQRTVAFTHGEFMWFMDYVIRGRNILDVSTHEQAHEEVPHTCQIWHYKFFIEYPDSFAFRKTLKGQPDTFSEWEHGSPRTPTREEIAAYIESNPRILFPKKA